MTRGTKLGFDAQRAHPDSLRPNQRERRERIVRSALKLLEDSDYDSIQVRDVSVSAGVALGTVYHYFSSKEHLYAAVMLEWAASFRSAIGREPLLGQTSAERLKELYGRVIVAFERRPQFLRVETILENSSDPQAQGLFALFSEQNSSTFTVALHTLPTAQAREVTGVVAIVLASMLHAWAAGRVSISTVYDTVFRSIDLIYSPPPGSSPL